MNTTEKSALELLHSHHWFDSAIESNPWIVYHATSSINEESIDTHGLHPTTAYRFANAALLAAKFFVNTGWTGFPGEDSGYLVLRSFSLERSHPSAGTPIYFALYPQRPYLYLKKDFCGGETAHALARAIPAIIKFASDDTAIDKHLNQLEECAIKKIKAGIPPAFRVFNPSREWMRNQAQQLEPFLEQLNHLRAAHRCGVLYAVRLHPADVDPATYSWSDGLRIHRNISPTQIVAKMRIFNEDALTVIGCLDNNAPPIDFDNAAQTARFNDSALVQSVRPPPITAPDRETLFAQLLDPAAGHDITWDLVRDYGNNYLRTWADQQLALPPSKRWVFAMPA